MTTLFLTMAKTRPSRRRRKTEQKATQLLKIALPVVKQDAKKLGKRRIEKINPEKAEENLKMAFGAMLCSIIRSAKSVTESDKSTQEKKKEDDQKKIAKALKEAKERIQKSKNVPQGTWELADRLRGVPAGVTKAATGAQTKQGPARKEYALDYFDYVAFETSITSNTESEEKQGGEKSRDHRKSMLDEDGCVPVSSPPTQVSEEDEDYVKLCQQERIQYIHQRYLGHFRTHSKASHPLWARLELDSFKDVLKSPLGLSNTVQRTK